VPKLPVYSLRYIFVADTMGLNFNMFDVVGSQSYQIQQNDAQ